MLRFAVDNLAFEKLKAEVLFGSPITCGTGMRLRARGPGLADTTQRMQREPGKTTTRIVVVAEGAY